MDRLTRLTAILIQLQTKRVLVAKEISERFGISLRTVYRDIRTLQNAGVPIGSQNGKGYFLVSDFHLPPIMLTEEEVNTLVIAEKLIHNQGDLSLRKDFTELLIKIKSVLKEDLKENYEKLEKRVAPSHIKVPYESNSLSDFKRAITKNLSVKIKYHSISKDEITERSLLPLGVYFSNKAWVLVAFCCTKNGNREFRLDRILDYTVGPETFSDKENFDLTEYFIEKNQSKLT